jgi:hypothetical protein
MLFTFLLGQVFSALKISKTRLLLPTHDTSMRQQTDERIKILPLNRTCTSSRPDLFDVTNPASLSAKGPAICDIVVLTTAPGDGALRVDADGAIVIIPVRIRYLTRISIRTEKGNVGVGDEMIFYATGFEYDGEEFTSLAGLNLNWTFDTTVCRSLDPEQSRFGRQFEY